MNSQQQSQEQLKQQILELDSAVKSLMAKEALQRYANIKLAHPEKALNLLMLLSKRINEGKTDQITDEEVKYYLQLLDSNRQTKINRV